MNASLEDQVRRWIALDPDESDRAELQALLDADNEPELERRFGAPLTFGTAGLRGPVMAGPAGMNRATVRRATLGVLAWFKEKGLDPAKGVIVGRDARRGSETFNDEVVWVLLGGGAVVYELPSPLPTPFVPYCVKALDAVAGIMITASHNPREDNGYKLYAADGAQIIPPDDEIVERHANLSPDVTLGARAALAHVYVAAETIDEYRTHMLKRFGVGASDLAITYTPMHGVGGETMAGLFRDAGFANVALVESQFTPDGSFPTLAFPNPEEPAALDLAIDTANAAGSMLIIANDPDADRLGAAVRGGNEWRVLRGDEIGWLLASSLLEETKKNGATMATTIVSSTLLAEMCREAEVPFQKTLTGFKWIARAAGNGVLGFGYEEALGFAVDPLVADKDGLSAALALAKLAHVYATQGRSLLDGLDDLETQLGVHATSQLAIRASGPEGLNDLRRAVHNLLASPPIALDVYDIVKVHDLEKGMHGLPPTEGVWISLGDLGRVVVRPSGTEAKVKAYIEITPPRTGTLLEQRARAASIVAAVRDSLSDLLRV